MKQDNFLKYVPELNSRLLSGGVFLNTRLGEEINTMTIGWALAGIMWGKPVFTVAVRYSRHTYRLIDKSGEFTVSIPADNKLNDALEFCGSKSGRDCNKFDSCRLTPVDAATVSVPVIGECGIHYECKTVYRQAMEPALTDERIKRVNYKANDYHVLYYGEILKCGKTDVK